ncbi:MAG: pyridoxamine kinase [Erysipelotrichaceae bacterium]|nr:pyridoxamine kinase [Erysipelotrichaceae bacterium]
MNDSRILTIQDISCVGQCSLTVALPILSACGIETAILPSAVLSTHTAGFKGFTFRDLSDDIPAIADHWVKEGIQFDAIYTGYLGSIQQIDYVKDIAEKCLKVGGKKIIDPAMADNGALYSIFDMNYAHEMSTLCSQADIILPNITEACFMTSTEYKTEYDQEYILNLLQKLSPDGKVTVVLTGVSYTPDTTGVVVYENRTYSYYEHKKISKGCHGTGDVYASAFTGALLNGHSTYEAAKIAADYVVSCIEYTQKDPTHWYGVKFEAKLAELIQSL